MLTSSATPPAPAAIRAPGDDARCPRPGGLGRGRWLELTYSRPELAVDHVRHTIEVDSGRPYGPGEAPGPIRRLMAALLRRARTGFTASELASVPPEGHDVGARG
jgi:hypothetical protein